MAYLCVFNGLIFWHEMNNTEVCVGFLGWFFLLVFWFSFSDVLCQGMPCPSCELSCCSLLLSLVIQVSLTTAHEEAVFPLNLEKVCSEWIYHCVPSTGSDSEEGDTERLLTPGRSLQGNV